MKSRSATMTARARFRIRNAGRGGLVLAVLWLVTLGVIAVTAAERQGEDTGIKVVRDVSYGPDARNVMDFYLPEGGATPRALVICIHGGGWAGGDKGRYAWLGEALARRGFAAVSLTYRFAPTWHAPAQLDDVQRAVRWLRKHADQYGLDPQRFGAIGGSAGGHLASYLALAETRDNSDPELAGYSSRVQCVVDCYGPVDLVGMMRCASAPIVQGFIGKPLEGNEEDYRKASAVSHVQKNPPPFLIVHGTKDVGTARGQVPIEQSVEFHAKLRQAGGEATLLKLEGAGHGFTGNGANQYAQETLKAALEFFTKHLMQPKAVLTAQQDRQDVVESPDLRSLKEAVGARFKVGVGVGHMVLRNPDDVALIRQHFDVLTPENCMKPQAIHPAEDRWNFEAADRFVDFARAHRLEVVGHCLVWAKDDRTDAWMMQENGKPVSRETLLRRIETHIQTVVRRYADAATMWDVVNEAIEDGQDGLLRDSVYSRTTGIDFIVAAFQAARAGDPEALLIYNDYNGHKPGKREKLLELLTELKRRGTPVDAYGMQGHFELGDDSIPQLRTTFDELRKLGLKVVVSELDIDVVTRSRWWADGGKYREELARHDPYRDGVPAEIQQRQVEQYVALFKLFDEYRDLIERVSFWNLHDGQSWLNYFPWRRVNHPLLFDRQRRPKPAFDAVYELLKSSSRSRPPDATGDVASLFNDPLKG